MQTLEFHSYSMHVVLYIQGTLVDQPLAEGTPSQQCAMETAIQLNPTGHPEFQTPPL